MKKYMVTFIVRDSGRMVEDDVHGQVYSGDESTSLIIVADDEDKAWEHVNTYFCSSKTYNFSLECVGV